MKKNIFSIIFAFITVIQLNLTAQVRTKIFETGVPENLLPLKAALRNEYIISAPLGFEKLILLQNGGTNNPEFNNRFASPVDVNFDVLELAKTIITDVDLTYYLSIKAENALNVSVQFKEFKLSPQAVLKIYTKKELTDSITANENNENNSWATRVYQGNNINIVLKIPKSEEGVSSLKINRVNFGYKNFGGEYFGKPGASVACNINIICPEANGWGNERNSVALIVANGFESCTGSLIMNTCGSNIPYFLTANHCLGAGNIPNWVFQFQYWSTTCIPNSGWHEDIQFNGCTLRANNAASDFALLELNTTPQPMSGIFYSGWSKNATTPSGTVGIHHPAGDLMKFSRDIDSSGVSSWGNINNHWVSVFEQGTVQPGSSGSPLYDLNHRIVGQLHGDQNNQGNYCAQRRGEYGKFDNSWTGGGTNSTRLSNWLDPFNSGATTTNTTNISSLTAPIMGNLVISGDNIFCTTSNSYTISNLPVNTPVMWTVTPQGIVTVNTPNATHTTLTKLGNGTITLTANISACGGNISVSKNINVGQPTIYNGTYNSNGQSLGLVESDGDTYDNTPCFTQYPASLNTIMDIRGANQITWSKLNSNPINLSWTQNGNNLGITYKAVGQKGMFSLAASNACGVAQKYYGFQTVNGCGAFAFRVSPNPANNSVSVENLSAEQNTNIKSIKIYDLYGNLKNSDHFLNTKKATVETLMLPAGVYIIEIDNGDYKEKQQLIIKK